MFLAEIQTSTIVLIIVGIVLLILFVIIFQFLGLYVRALVSGARVSIIDLIGMRLRNVNPPAIVNARIQAMRAGLDITTAEMESHVLAGGDVQRVINAMIAASKANIDLNWQTATAIDLAGRDILEAVQTSVNPKVIDVPSIAIGTYCPFRVTWRRSGATGRTMRSFGKRGSSADVISFTMRSNWTAFRSPIFFSTSTYVQFIESPSRASAVARNVFVLNTGIVAASKPTGSRNSSAITFLSFHRTGPPPRSLPTLSTTSTVSLPPCSI